MSLTDLWRSMRDRRAVPDVAAQAGDPSTPTRKRKAVPARTARPVADAAPSFSEVTPFAGENLYPDDAEPAPPIWQDLFPGHYRALVADLAKRGQGMTGWEVQDGSDLGITETGHTVAFTLGKSGTSATMRVELTLFKGQLSRVRVR